MRWIPPEKVDEIIQKADIVEVISEYLPLKKKGSNYWALSPFKQERNPSFAVSPTKQIFKDFSSGKGGNVVTFLMEIEGFTYWEALTYLAKKYNIELPEAPGDREKARLYQQKKESLLIALQYAKEFYKRQLAQKSELESYLSQRGLSEETVRTFELGYAPGGGATLYSHLKSLQFSDEILLETGLVRKREDGQIEDFFRDRLMFPITDSRKRVIAFGGRVLRESFGPKYLNSSETLLFKKQETLYGFGHSRIAVKEAERVYVVEGYFDLLSLWESGIYNVVATCGTSLTEAHAVLLKRFCKEVVLLFDSDEAGVRAALRAIRMLLQAGLEVKIILLDGEKDPNDLLVSSGPEAVKAILTEEAIGWIDFLLQRLGLGSSPKPDQLHEAIHSVASYLAHLSDPIQLELYLAYSSERLGVEKELLIRVLKEHRKANERGVVPRVHPLGKSVEKRQDYPTDGATREILRVLLNHYSEEVEFGDKKMTVWEALESLLKEVEFENPIYEEIRKVFLKGMTEMSTNPLHFLLTHENEEVRRVATDLLVQRELSPHWERWDVYEQDRKNLLLKQLQETISHFNFQVISKWLKETLQELKETQERGESEIQEQLNRYQRLLALRREWAEKLGIVIKEIPG